MQPFKRPRPNTAAGPRPLEFASNPAPRAPQAVVASSKGSSTASTTDTWSSIRAPSSEGQNKRLLELPRFRKDQSTDEDVGWVFRNVFNKTDYKGRQKDIMEASLKGADILVIAPTGMGKSLCFQVPAVAERHGLTLVVSPLLSLMQDQIAALKRLEIPCAMLSSKTSPEEQKEILNDMESGHPKNRLLYITPERLSSAPFRKKLRILHKQQELNRLVVDEAHCISEWGHDFRPEYSKLGEFRGDFPKVPIMALTASATPKVQEDITSELAMDPDLLFKVIHPFNRPNLFYEIRHFSESNDGSHYRQDDILSFITRLVARGGNRPTAGIIYCRAKKTCDELSAWLRGKGVFAAPYHRGLKDFEADENQRRWVENDDLADSGKPRVDCIVATIAFGMGIDKSNCRYVIHYDVPKSFEGYYQETGRAGRDGHVARCIMYYSAEDKLRIKELVRKSHSSRERKYDRIGGAVPSQRAPESIDALTHYAEDVKTCRHILICRYFGEKVTQSDAASYCTRLCDICRDPAKVRKRRDEGLVELDFAATQAVNHDVDEYDVDPDDFYETGARDEFEGSQEESEEEEEEGEEQPARKCREGFRTAAVERDRAQEKLSRISEGSYSSSPPDAEVEYAVPLKGGEEDETEPQPAVGMSPPRSLLELSDDDPRPDEMDFPSPAQPSRSDSKRRKSPPPPQPVFEEVSLPSDEEDEEVLPHWRDVGRTEPAKSAPKENRPPSAPSAPKVATKIVPIVQVAQKLPLLGAVGQGQLGAFTTPFTDPTRNPKYKANLSLKNPGEAASSVGDEPPGKFDVNPSNYEKKIPVALRNEAVVHLVKYLQRAFLSKHGFRSSDSEEEVWKDLGAKQADHEMRRKILLATAIELESDLFWTSLTPIGFRQFLAPRTEAVKKLIVYDGKLPTVEGEQRTSDPAVEEVVKALKRAVGSTLPRKKVKRKIVDSDEE
ncbi:P-loop containing nucleoside triphosphate hydrolase protein [Leucosporidium creatinivorum]|uniref:ATP-dependent DNA helicase n=1 Tax=Leucosporidium creatinivorum TaxID=106004 RepID=A0A1Y2C5X8_9BASI|nr:P-loop containing nucleoside triphosphate hydrolase protein [Leucosporidium creatinivorum]